MKNRSYSLLLAAVVSILFLRVPTAHATSWMVEAGKADGNPGSLRYFLNNAALQDGDTIVLPAGTILVSPTAGSFDIDGKPDLDVPKSITLQGAGAGLTIIDGNGSVTKDRVFEVTEDANVSFSGMTIQHGDGGTSGGGGILNAGSGTLRVVNSFIKENRAESGGGINSSGLFQMTDSRVSDNLSTGTGGGLFLGNGANLFRTEIDANLAQGDGGGVFSHGDNVRILNSPIHNNQAWGGGGGIANDGDGASLANVTVGNNTANGSGGGVWNGGSMSMAFTTLRFNVSDADSGGASAGDGGGLFNRGSFYLFTSIIAGNTDASAGHEAPDCYSDSAAPFLKAFSPDIVQNLAGCSISSGAGNILNVDPLFAESSDNGTFALSPGSPAIDAAGYGGPPIDQRGAGRPVDGNGDSVARWDLGAYEYAAVGVSLPLAVCGDGVLAWPEVCDDGNDVSGDGCNSLCFPEIPAGSTSGGYGTSGGMGSTAGPGGPGGPGGGTTGGTTGGTGGVTGGGTGKISKIDNWGTGNFPVFYSVCGNGKVESGEECDDGNLKNGDWCSATCKRTLIIQKVPWLRTKQLDAF